VIGTQKQSAAVNWPKLVDGEVADGKVTTTTFFSTSRIDWCPRCNFY
jgi:hypothetical protein